MERLFKLKEHGTNVRTEIIAGFTTFMTMAYILVVNNIFLGPNGAGIPAEGVFFATAVGAGLVTILMGLFVNIPVALAPGMGLNAYFMAVVLGSNGEITWQTALGAVFISGIIFIILTVTKVRQMLVEAVPNSIKMAITAGIGLFITIIGMKLSNIVQASVTPGAEGTLVPGPLFNLSLGNFLENKDTLLALIGLLIIGLLMVAKVKGALLIGIVVTTLLGIPLGVTNVEGLSGADWIPSFDNLAVGQLDIWGALVGVGVIEVIFIFTFVELFDTFGTLIGTTTRAGILSDKNKKEGEKKIGRAMLVDAAGVSGGALLGTSTITAYIESNSGIEEGGRTGLTAVTTGVLFLLALFIAPLALVVPSAATAPALIVVGVLMISQVRHIEWDNFVAAFSAFLTIVMMPFTNSIANGISFGIVSYTLLALASNLFTKNKVKIHWLMWVLTILIIVRYAFLGAE